jgi:hypothetical protein
MKITSNALWKLDLWPWERILKDAIEVFQQSTVFIRPICHSEIFNVRANYK